MIEAIALSGENDGENQDVIDPVVGKLGLLMNLANGDRAVFSYLLREEFRYFNKHGIAFVIGLLGSPEAAFAFREQYALAQERMGILVRDIRDADVYLGAIRLDLQHWFIRGEGATVSEADLLNAYS